MLLGCPGFSYEIDPSMPSTWLSMVALCVPNVKSLIDKVSRE